MSWFIQSVLVVDDDDEVRAITAETLRSVHLTVLEAGNGDEALQILAEHAEIGVLFCDVLMPGINGAAVAVEARRRWPELQIILTSGYVGGVVMRDVAFLPKPYAPRDVIKAVATRVKIGD
jgi:CheY-like chemotaxis protein